MIISSGGVGKGRDHTKREALTRLLVSKGVRVALGTGDGLMPAQQDFAFLRPAGG